jgi:hypothetical protein
MHSSVACPSLLEIALRGGLRPAPAYVFGQDISLDALIYSYDIYNVNDDMRPFNQRLQWMT